jgi:hypothetical protein
MILQQSRGKRAWKDQSCAQEWQLSSRCCGNFSAQTAVSAFTFAYWLYLPHSAGIL